MAITTHESADGERVTIRVAGRFDFATHQAFSQAYKQFPKGDKCFVVDLRDTVYLDSSAMGMLLQLRSYSTNCSSVTIINGNAGIQEILHIANFDKLFTMA